MLSKSSSRALLILTALLIAVSFAGCKSADRGTTEEKLTASFTDLLPAGRVYTNDLAATGEFKVLSAYLFGGEILVQDVTGGVLSLNRRNLEPKWSYTGMEDVLDHPPAVTPISVLLVSKGLLYEVERKYGNELHKFRLGFVPSAGPAGTDSSAYLPSLGGVEGNRTLITLNLANGLEGWGLATRGPIGAAPKIGGTATRPMVFFATENGAIYAVPASSSVSLEPEISWSRSAYGRIVRPLPTTAKSIVPLLASRGLSRCLK